MSSLINTLFHIILSSATLMILSILMACGDRVDDYHRAKMDPIHFAPGIHSAKDEECLECHKEIISRNTRVSPAGVVPESVLAWYQTVSTYEGKQQTFHQRHLTGPLAQKTMDLKCNFCHRGHDPFEEGAVFQNSDAAKSNRAITTMRKQVHPEKVCLQCHGQFPYELMGLSAHWEESGEAFNGNCMACHAAIRTNRHNVSFLKRESIEEHGQKNGDLCYGCHGGRAWYRTTYPYPRSPWPGMPEQTPEWAKGRPARAVPGE